MPLFSQNRAARAARNDRASYTCVMSTPLHPLFHNNREWVRRVLAEDPDFFTQLAQQQAPEYLWIGCSDSRVPANQITGLAPGEVFVHRNVANVVVHTDLNSLSVIQFAVDLLKVRHIMVVGHYGCSGVHAALKGTRVGIADNWLRHVRDVHEKHADLMAHCPSSQHHDRLCELNVVEQCTPETRHDRLCELNAVEQAVNVCHTTVVQDAWARGQDLTVHAWVYGLNDGLIHDLGFAVNGNAALKERYAATVAAIGRHA